MPVIWWEWIGILVLTAGMLGGCTTPPVALPEWMEPVMVPVDDAKSWWYVRFRLTWPEGEEPPWWPDLLLADRGVGPVPAAGQAAISLWRFHKSRSRI